MTPTPTPETPEQIKAQRDEPRKLTKFCVSCKKDGHTYLECREQPFADMLCQAFGVPNLLTQQTKD